MNQGIDVKEVLQEVGRMHLHIMTLERQLAEAQAKIVELTPKPAPKE
jgi:hypothetical protein